MNRVFKRGADRLRSEWVFFLALAIGLSYVLPAIGWGSAMPGNLGDARFNSIVLENSYLWVSGRVDRFWDPGFFYPFRNVLAFSDNHIGSGPVYVAFRGLGFDRMAAFQCWFVVGHVATLACAYIAHRMLGFSTVASAFGALIFAFALTVLAKAGHAQMVYRFATPLAFAMFWLALRDARPDRLGWVAIWTTWQFLCSIYLGLFLIMLMFAAFLCFLLFGGSRQALPMLRNIGAMPRRQVVVTLLQVVGSAALLGGLLLQYALVKHEYGIERSFAEIWPQLPRLQSYLLADGSKLWAWLGRSLGESLMMRHEHQMFIGGFAALLAGLSLFALRGAHEWNLLLKVCLGSLLLLVVVTLAVDPSFTIYRAVLEIPGISAARAVARISLVLLVPVAILAAISIDTFSRKIALPKPVVVSVLAILSFVETRSFTPLITPVVEWEARIAELEQRVPTPFPPDGILFVTAPDQDTAWFPAMMVELDAMIVAQDMNVPTLNGYSGTFPPGYEFPLPCINLEGRITRGQQHAQRGAPTTRAILDRVVTVSGGRCPFSGPQLSSSGPIDTSIAKDIDLQVKPGAAPDSYIVTITNRSSQPLITASSTGTPVLLSWRFVSDDGSAAPGWDTRHPLGFTLSPGETASVELNAPHIETGQPQLLEVSMLQEMHFWFHDHGLRIAETRVGALVEK